MKLVLTGGGTLGSVGPLIAVWQALGEKDASLTTLFVGTKSGPEKEFVKTWNLEFSSIPSGKLRRYFSLQNLIDPFRIVAGFFKAFFVLKKFKPDVVFSAGGFVAVPVVLAGKLLGARVIIHQLDLKPTLSNRLVSGLADKITVTFEKSLNDFSSKKTLLVGSVLRREIRGSNNPVNKKRILVLGGGTGALALNKLVSEALAYLPKDILVCQMTGQGKKTEVKLENYQSAEFFRGDYYARIAEASLVLTRAGLSTLMELSYLGKPSIIVPIPKSHQEKNAEFFSHKRSALYLKQGGLTPRYLADRIKELLADQARLDSLSRNIHLLLIHGGERKIADIIYGFTKN